MAETKMKVNQVCQYALRSVVQTPRDPGRFHHTHAFELDEKYHAKEDAVGHVFGGLLKC